jgi:hypothetical protein
MLKVGIVRGVAVNFPPGNETSIPLGMNLLLQKCFKHRHQARCSLPIALQASAYLTRALPKTRHFPKTSSLEYCASHVFSALWNWPVPCIRTA